MNVDTLIKSEIFVYIIFILDHTNVTSVKEDTTGSTS